MRRRVVLCALADVPPGRMRRVDTDHAGPLLVCNVDGAPRVVADTCTHADASLSEGDLEGDRLICPAHWAEFDVATGRALSFPATESLAVYPASVEDGYIITCFERAET